MTFERFQYAFVNDMSLDEQRAAFERYVVPESRRVTAESLTNTAKVDFARPHAPLLLIAGGNDHISPASLNRVNYDKYKASPSTTELKEFPGRRHFIIGQKNLQEVADYASKWLNDQQV